MFQTRLIWMKRIIKRIIKYIPPFFDFFSPSNSSYTAYAYKDASGIEITVLALCYTD